MILSVAVEEHTELEEWVRAIFNSRNHTARGEGSLFDVTMVVLRVLVEDKAAKFVHLQKRVW